MYISNVNPHTLNQSDLNDLAARCAPDFRKPVAFLIIQRAGKLSAGQAAAALVRGRAPGRLPPELLDALAIAKEAGITLYRTVDPASPLGRQLANVKSGMNNDLDSGGYPKHFLTHVEPGSGAAGRTLFEKGVAPKATPLPSPFVLVKAIWNARGARDLDPFRYTDEDSRLIRGVVYEQKPGSPVFGLVLRPWKPGMRMISSGKEAGL